MPEASDRPTAMLIVKAWREDTFFRATVSSSSDITSGESSEHAAAGSPGEVLSIVGQWLRSV